MWPVQYRIHSVLLTRTNRILPILHERVYSYVHFTLSSNNVVKHLTGYGVLVYNSSVKLNIRFCYNVHIYVLHMFIIMCTMYVSIST